MTASLATHVDRWARGMSDAGLLLVATTERGSDLASACRDERAAGMPPVLVAVARRLPEGDLASLEARLVRSLARVSA